MTARRLSTRRRQHQQSFLWYLSLSCSILDRRISSFAILRASGASSSASTSYAIFSTTFFCALISALCKTHGNTSYVVNGVTAVQQFYSGVSHNMYGAQKKSHGYIANIDFMISRIKTRDLRQKSHGWAELIISPRTLRGK